MALIDWEPAGWGPPVADSVCYRTNWAALRGTPVEGDADPEGVRFWAYRITGSAVNKRDARLAASLHDVIEALTAAGSRDDGAES